MTQEGIIILLGKIGIGFMVLPILIGIWQWRNLNFPIKLFWYYRVLAVLFNIAEQVFIWFAINNFAAIKPFVERFNIANTNFLAISYQLNNIFWLGWFYFILTSVRQGRWIRLTSIILFLAILTNYLFIEGMNSFGQFNPTVTALFTFGVAFFYLWYIYRSQLALPLGKNPYYWFSLGLILPYLSSFFLFIIGNDTQEENFALFITMSIMKDAFLIIAQLLFAIGFYRARYARFVPLPSETVD